MSKSRCLHDKTHVVRTIRKEFVIRRERKCTSCGRKFWTTENRDEPSINVYKLSGKMEPFKKEKIRRSIQLAFGQLKISQEKREEIVNKVTEEVSLLTPDSPMITSTDIGELVLENLRKLDPAIWLRFASHFYYGRNYAALEATCEQLEQTLQGSRENEESE